MTPPNIGPSAAFHSTQPCRQGPYRTNNSNAAGLIAGIRRPPGLRLGDGGQRRGGGANEEQGGQKTAHSAPRLPSRG